MPLELLNLSCGDNKSYLLIHEKHQNVYPSFMRKFISTFIRTYDRQQDYRCHDEIPAHDGKYWRNL